MESGPKPETDKSQLFPRTRWTLVLKTRDSESRADALEELCQLYWSPVYFFIRTRGVSAHDAEDRTQGFFAQLLEREQFQRAAKNPAGGRLRSYLLKSVQNFLITQHERETAQKRGGSAERVSLETKGVERLFIHSSQEGISPQEMFDQRWAANLLEQVFLKLEKEYENADRGNDFAILKATLGQTAKQVPFSEMAAKLGMEEGAARVAAFRLRKQFRAILHDEIRETTASEEDFQEELSHLKKLMGG